MINFSEQSMEEFLSKYSEFVEEFSQPNITRWCASVINEGKSTGNKDIQYYRCLMYICDRKIEQLTKAKLNNVKPSNVKPN